MKINTFFRTKKEVEDECRDWAKEIKANYSPDLIVFIAKSGFLFGRVLGDNLECDIVDVSISRPHNGRLDIIKKYVPNIPKWMLAYYLTKKVSRATYANEGKRMVSSNERLDSIDFNYVKKILIVDDSVDTGWSLNKAVEYIRSKGYQGELKVASFCVLSQAFERSTVDFYRHLDSIIITATSRYSKEYTEFIHDYEGWKRSYFVDKRKD
jgi:hypoxanthine phosphoribosyltransferase